MTMMTDLIVDSGGAPHVLLLALEEERSAIGRPDISAPGVAMTYGWLPRATVTAFDGVFIDAGTVLFLDRELEDKIARVVAAIADGTDTPALRAHLVALEAQKAELASSVGPDEPDAGDVALMPDLAKRYRAKVAMLEQALTEDPRTRAGAAEEIRELVDSITAMPRNEPAQWDLKLTGRLEAILALAAGTLGERRHGTQREHDRKGVIASASPGGLEPPFSA